MFSFKKNVAMVLSLVMVFGFTTSTLASTENINSTPSLLDEYTIKNASNLSVADPYSVKETIVNENYIEGETVVDNSFVKDKLVVPPVKDGSVVTPLQIDCGCAGTYSSPIRIGTNTVNLYGTPIEYGFFNNQFVILKRPDLYYYTQNATQTHFNMVTGKFAQTAANGWATFVLFKGADKIPYMARLFKNMNAGAPYNFGDYTKTVSSYMVQSQVPLWSKIVNAGVPTVGTKQVLVYVSTSGKDNTWHKRILFTIGSNKSVSYTTSYAN